jgi:lysylphosphatidylglycerol synthetase-like protein (DUF2156 family)
MRILVLVINYIFLAVWILASTSLLKVFNASVLLWVIIFFVITIPNIIYAHGTRPVDKEKEDLKRQIEELSKENEENN